MKIAPFYLWFNNPFLNIAEIRSFATELGAERWYYNSGLLGKAMMCYSLSDVLELIRHVRAAETLISFVR